MTLLSVKEFIKKIPVVGNFARHTYRHFVPPRQMRPLQSSGQYWEERYSLGGNSGAGSYQKFAEFKAEIINEFVLENNVRSVIEFGCGDGNQLLLAKYHKYTGFDVSPTAINKCRKLFAPDVTKTFECMDKYVGRSADLALTLDVIYHLIEEKTFEDYMRTLFSAARRYVIIYSSDFDNNDGNHGPHVRHRNFSKWISGNLPNWKLLKHIPNRYPYKGDYTKGSFADFFIYEKNTGPLH